MKKCCSEKDECDSYIKVTATVVELHAGEAHMWSEAPSSSAAEPLRL